MVFEPLSPEDAFENGRVLADRYRINGSIGGGGMAHVYRAQHLELAHVVAIKVLHASHSRDRETVLRFQREAAMARRLGHPNIVTIIDSGVLADGRDFVVMEALDGETLEARIAREERIPWRIAVSLLAPAFGGDLDLVADLRGLLGRDVPLAFGFALPGMRTDPVGAFMRMSAPRRGS